MKLKKLTLGTSTVILSSGLLFGCGNANDEQEPNPTEEPSEQQQDYNNNGSDINEDPVKNQDENIQDNQNQNGQDKNDQDNNDKGNLNDILQPGQQ